MYLAVIMRASPQTAPAEAWSPPHTCSSLTHSPASPVIRSLLAVLLAKLQRYPLSCTKQVLRRIAPWSQCRSAQSARGVIHFSIWSPAWDELTDVDWFSFPCNCERCLRPAARALYLRAMGGAHVIISALYIPAASGCYFDVFTFLPSLLKRIKLPLYKWWFYLYCIRCITCERTASLLICSSFTERPNHSNKDYTSLLVPWRLSLDLTRPVAFSQPSLFTSWLLLLKIRL